MHVKQTAEETSFRDDAVKLKGTRSFGTTVAERSRTSVSCQKCGQPASERGLSCVSGSQQGRAQGPSRSGSSASTMTSICHLLHIFTSHWPFVLTVRRLEFSYLSPSWQQQVSVSGIRLLRYSPTRPAAPFWGQRDKLCHYSKVKWA